MKKSALITIVLLLGIYATAKSQDFELQNTPSKDSAVIFLPGVVSTENRWEYCVSFIPNTSKVIFTSKQGNESAKVYIVEQFDNNWTAPKELPLLLDTLSTYAMEAFPTLDGKRLYYTVCDSIGCDIWYVDINGSDFKNPTKLKSELNNDVVFYSTFLENGDMIYTNVSKMKSYYAEFSNGSYTEFYEAGFGGAHGFPAKDGSYIVVNSKGEFGNSDIFVYFKLDDGTWSKPINLGERVNTPCSESCPSLSPDGKYLFFNRYCKDENTYDIYWIKSSFIHELKP